jgi:hypothetical protein
LTFQDDSRITEEVSTAVNADLVNMWRSAIMKARQQDSERRPADTTTALVINFDGAGLPLSIGMGGVPQLPPGAYRIVGCHMTAAIWNPVTRLLSPVSVTASVDLRLASVGLWASGGTPLYPPGLPPSLSNQIEAEIDLTGWTTSLQPGDLISYVLTDIAGTATVLTLTLSLRRVDLIGVQVNTLDDGDTTFTDEDGVPFEVRG